MGVVMERGVKIMFLGVVAVIAAEGILRKTIEAIGDTNQWSYAIGCMMLYLFITIMIYALVMGGINMFISMISDMKRERVVEAKLDVQESDVVLQEESIPVVAEAEAPGATAGIERGRPSQGIDDIFRDKAKGKEGIWKIEIKMKEVTGVNESQSQGTGKKMG